MSDMWRCANDVFGYCSGEPDWTEKPRDLAAGPPLREQAETSPYGGACRNDPKTCFYYRTASQFEVPMAERLVAFRKAKAKEEKAQREAAKQP